MRIANGKYVGKLGIGDRWFNDKPTAVIATLEVEVENGKPIKTKLSPINQDILENEFYRIKELFLIKAQKEPRKTEILDSLLSIRIIGDFPFSLYDYVIWDKHLINILSKVQKQVKEIHKQMQRFMDLVLLDNLDKKTCLYSFTFLRA